jgi:exosome complex protein LRP1
VKQYFEKIKVAEAGPTKPRENISLNKQAAGRVIKHALAGNDKYDLERAEREAREKLLARRKLNKLIEEKMGQKKAPDKDETPKDVEVQDDSESESESSSEEDDRQDAVMADAETAGHQVTTDTSIASNAQDSRLAQRQQYRDKRARRHNAPKAASAPITAVEGSVQSLGRKRKKKSRDKGEAVLGGQTGGFP